MKRSVPFVDVIMNSLEAWAADYGTLLLRMPLPRYGVKSQI